MINIKQRTQNTERRTQKELDEDSDGKDRWDSFVRGKS